MTEFVCIGAPYFIGEHLTERTEVDAIQASGLAAELDAPWVTVQPDFAVQPDPITAVSQALAAAITAHSDRIPLVFSSDCVNALGTMKGLEAQQPGILWVDAHGDFNTPETTPSGFLGGMPLAWLVGRGDLRYMTGLDLKPVREESVILADARNLDPGEQALLDASAVTRLSVDDLRQVDWANRPLYIHLDLDVIDPSDMPAMIYLESGGPTLDQVVDALRDVAQQAHVVGILFSLWNDSLPGADRALPNMLRLARDLAEALRR